MGPRTGVDAVGGGHERFFEVPNFFSTVRFGSPVLERPFWTARFWTARFGSDARFGQPVLDSPSIGPIQPPQLGTAPQLLSSSWLLMAQGTWCDDILSCLLPGDWIYKSNSIIQRYLVKTYI